MKKLLTLIALLVFGGMQYASAQEVQVVDLAGDYVCVTPGVPGGLDFELIGQSAELTFCRDLNSNDCSTYTEIYPTVVDGEILAKPAEPGNPPVHWPDIRFQVEMEQGRVFITAGYADGVDYRFERQ